MATRKRLKSLKLSKRQASEPNAHPVLPKDRAVGTKTLSVSSKQLNALTSLVKKDEAQRAVVEPRTTWQWDDDEHGPIIDLQDSEDEGVGQKEVKTAAPAAPAGQANGSRTQSSSLTWTPVTLKQSEAVFISSVAEEPAAKQKGKREAVQSNSRRLKKRRTKAATQPAPKEAQNLAHFPKMDAEFVQLESLSESTNESEDEASSLEEEEVELQLDDSEVEEDIQKATKSSPEVVRAPATEILKGEESHRPKKEEEEEEEEEDEEEDLQASASARGRPTTLDLLTVKPLGPKAGCLVYMLDGGCLTFFGRLKLRILFGAVQLFGRRLTNGTEINVTCPKYHGALPIKAFPIAIQKADERQFADGAAEFGVDTKEVISGLSAVLLLQDFEPSALDKHIQRLIACSQIDSPQEKEIYVSFPSRHFTLRTASFISKLKVQGGNAVIEYTDDILKQLPKQLFDSSTGCKTHYPRGAPVVAVVGDADTGKSTFCRYLINCLLNNFPSVHFLDTDLGQSEFTPPGMVSLTRCSSTVVGPPYCHLANPELAHYVGNTTMERCRDAYINAVKDLLEFYQQQQGHATTPLIMNTHGWVAESGWDATMSFLRMSFPDHIFVMQPSAIDLKALTNDLRSPSSSLLPVPEAHRPEITCLNVLGSASHKGKTKPNSIQRTAALTTHFGGQFLTFCDWMTRENIDHLSCDECGGICFGDFLMCWLPYKVAMKGLAITVPSSNLVTELAESLLDILNGALVGLEVLKEEGLQKATSTSHGLLLLPSINMSLSRTVGLGIVRQIRPETKELYLVTSVAPSVLQEVNCLSIGPNPLPLHWRLPASGAEPYPYTTYLFVEGLGCGRMV